MRAGPVRCVWCIAVAVGLAAAAPAPAQLTFNFTYQDEAGYGFNDATSGAARKAVVEAVAAYLGTVFDARGAIAFEWERSFINGDYGPLATAGTGYSFTPGVTRFTNGQAFRAGTTGAAGAGPHGSGTFDFGPFTLGSTTYTLNTSPTANSTTTTQFDMRTVALHELSHALGFSSAVNADGSGFGTAGAYTYTRFDSFIRVGSTATSPALIANGGLNSAQGVTTADLTGGNLYFDGPISRAANGGNAVKLYAPATFSDGSSISHTDPTANPNSVMNPAVVNGKEKRTYTSVDLAMLIDLGWNTYVWKGTGGNWAANVDSATGSLWQNVDGTNERSPVGTITPNVVLRFTGTATNTSTNGLDLSAANNTFLVNRVSLESTGALTIASNGTNVLQFGTDIGVTPAVLQTASGSVAITHPVRLTAAGLTLGGDGTGIVNLLDTIAQVAGATAGLTKTGAGTFVLSGANTFSGPVTISGGVFRAGNTSGSATGTGAVTVQSGGTLGGTVGKAVSTVSGRIAGNVTVSSGGVVAPGGTTAGAATAGQIHFIGTTQTVTFAAGSRYTWTMSALVDNTSPVASGPGVGFDQVRATHGSGLSLAGGTVHLAFSTAATPNVSTPFWQSAHVWTILSSTTAGDVNTSQFGGIDNASDYSSVGTFTLARDVANLGSITLAFAPVGVPEPGCVLLVAAGVGFAVRRRRG